MTNDQMVAAALALAKLNRDDVTVAVCQNGTGGRVAKPCGRPYVWYNKPGRYRWVVPSACPKCLLPSDHRYNDLWHFLDEPSEAPEPARQAGDAPGGAT